MTRGRKVCNTLKEIRRQIAQKNEIEYSAAECRFEGECRGTCPKCEAELKYIENELHKRRLAGKAATVAGISLGIAGAFSACNAPQPQQADTPTIINSVLDYDLGGIDEEIMMGVVAYSEHTTSDGEEIFYFCDEMPKFLGGQKELEKFLADNIVYPKEAIEKRIEGTVLVRFVVRKDGKISDITLLRSPHKLLSEEAIRVVKKMSKWKPGTQEGMPVNVYFILPIEFQLKD